MIDMSPTTTPWPDIVASNKSELANHWRLEPSALDSKHNPGGSMLAQCLVFQWLSAMNDE
jgi:hypothetical protein